MPKEAVLLVTRRCNYHCSYCAIAHVPIPELKVEEWRQIVWRLKEWGVKVFGISGGEPLMLPGLVKEIVAVAQPMHTFIISNGSVIDSKAGRKLGAELITEGLYGYSSSMDDQHLLHDEDHGLNSMRIMRDMGCPDVTCSLTAYAGNIDTLPSAIDDLSREGIYSVVSIVHATNPPFPVQWCFRQNDISVLPTVAQVKRFSGVVLDIYDSTLIHTPRSYFENLPKVFRPTGNFKWHCQKPNYIQVDSDGSFMPCPDLLSDKKILDMSIEEMQIEFEKAVNPCPGCYYACEVQSEAIDDPVRSVFKR